MIVLGPQKILCGTHTCFSP